MSSKKKPVEQTEPPAEPVAGYAADDAEGGGSLEMTLAPPLAARKPALEDRVAALELAVIKLDDTVTKHNRYHFGGST